MALTGIYGPVARDEGIAVIRNALDQGIVHYDTAELYGPYTNEELLSEALGNERSRVTIATKVGYDIRDGVIAGLDSRPRSIRRAVEGSLRRLRTDRIDVLYQHRPDPKVPVEDAVGTISDLIREGKVLSIGLSAVDRTTLLRAQAVHEIGFVQNEFSLINRVPQDLLSCAHASGTKLVCYSPLGRGILASSAASISMPSADDYRRKDARFEPQQRRRMLQLLGPLWQIAAERSIAPATVSLAWLLAQGPNIQVIPGVKSREQLRNSLAAEHLQLSDQELHALDGIEAS